LLTRTFALEAFGRHQQAGSIDPHEGVAFSRVEARRSRHLRRIGKECRAEFPSTRTRARNTSNRGGLMKPSRQTPASFVDGP
jgi:hypothetical protein